MEGKPTKSGTVPILKTIEDQLLRSPSDEVHKYGGPSLICSVVLFFLVNLLCSS